MLCAISASPYYNDFSSLINLLTKQDEVLLLQNGVLMGHKIYSKNKDNKYVTQLRNKGIHIFALEDDVDARGLTLYMSSYIRQISYIDFVQLTVKHQQYFSW
ncbi:Protein TusB [Candidatus Arsenophonus lipoptenae]|uniref:Protein TusB n=1 Tax=Candidatus Arsenophonus lipoptenae TaxID=634113 RepID=A0A120HPV1_9GAMM|nr:sulfurtransferase complex subunit TusB [Candidatus Arsenophonus lipoptenae]AMA64874.1 Protein TusB [Candidatus Arsenophonus lipoptenae]